ncbi:MAG: ABC transporter substrate-binding protein [Gammaproteobacteria bacterium]|nr:ABC transporter substrate-binding protein [Gammaproteobacteria bacterium]
MTSTRKLAAILAALASVPVLAERDDRDRGQLVDRSGNPVVEQRPATSLDGLEFKHGIALYHDLKYPPDYSHLEYLDPNAPRGGMLVLPTGTNFDTFAPIAERGTGAPGRRFQNDSLIIRSGDELSAFYGRIADGIAITDDRMTVVFRIHPRARWRDGVPITSSDIAFSVESLRSRIAGRLYYRVIDSVERIDDRHVAFHLNEPLQLPTLMSFDYLPIMPEHYWRDRDPSASTLTPPLTSGPYFVSGFRQGRFVVYQRDPDYWGRDIPVNKGRYNFDTIRFEVYRDASVTREAFRKGLIDIWDESDARYWHSGFDIPALQRGWIRKIRRNSGLEVGIREGIVLNNRRERFKDRRIREALTLAVDFEWQNRTLHYGYHKRAHSYWPDTILAATGMPSADELVLLRPYRDQLPAVLFEKPFRFPEIENEEDHRTLVSRARELLREAGWFIVDGVLTNSAGDIFEIEFLTRSPSEARTLLPYFQRLEQLGIRARMAPASGDSEWINRLRRFGYDAALVSMRIQMPPVIGLVDRFHSDSATVPTSANRSGISNPVVDFLIEKAVSATALPQMIAACRALDRVLLWQYYQIPLYAVDRRTTVHWGKFGRPDYEPKYQPAYPDGWWYDTDKAARIVGHGVSR